MCSFIHETNISQGGHQEKFSQFYLYEIDRTTSESS